MNRPTKSSEQWIKLEYTKVNHCDISEYYRQRKKKPKLWKTEKTDTTQG